MHYGSKHARVIMPQPLHTPYKWSPMGSERAGAVERVWCAKTQLRERCPPVRQKYVKSTNNHKNEPDSAIHDRNPATQFGTCRSTEDTETGDPPRHRSRSRPVSTCISFRQTRRQSVHLSTGYSLNLFGSFLHRLRGECCHCDTSVLPSAAQL